MQAGQIYICLVGGCLLFKTSAITDSCQSKTTYLYGPQILPQVVK